MTRTRHNPAFTLVELVLVLAIAAILAAIAVPKYSASVAHSRADAAAARVAADLRGARTLAMTTGVPRVVRFDVAGDFYDVAGEADLDRAGVYTVRLRGDPYAVSLAGADFGGFPSARFDAFGGVAAGGGVTLRVGPAVRRVSLDAATGRVTVSVGG